MIVGTRAGIMLWVFIRMPIPRTIPAIPRRTDSFVMFLLRYFGL